MEDFVGRREDLAEILPAFFDNQPILLKGQGGIGKTTFARKLAQRLRAKNPDTVCFVFNEEGKEFSVDKVLEQLKSLSVDKGKSEWIKELEHLGDSVVLKIQSLLKKLGDHFFLFILFDNVESFQNLETEEFLTDHEAALAIINYSARHPKIHTIVTGRYLIQELDGLFKEFDLKDIDRNDFTRKCYDLKLFILNEERMEFLYKSVGGNFRFVEFFVKAFVDDGNNLKTDFANFESFAKEIEKAKDQALPEMDSFKKFIFEKLWQKLDSDEQEIAQILYHFSLPVIDIAFELQGFAEATKTKLQRLKELTLIQVYWDRETDLIYYFMPPLVKNLLERQTDIENTSEDFHEKAGRYHYYMFHGIHAGNISDYEAAYHHFCRSANSARINEIGDKLSGFYYDRALFRNSLEIAQTAFDVFGDAAPFWCGNRIGMNLLRFGKYEEALFSFQFALSKAEMGDKGIALNNISQIYQAQGNYTKALEYLEQSLKIRRGISDKSGEGVTLSNIGQVYQARGDTTTALEYFEQSLKIMREVGDKSGEGVTLSNVGQICRSQGDTAMALEYLEQSLKIMREIGDKSGEAATLGNIGQVHQLQGDYATAREYLEQSLKIVREIGDKSVEGVALGNIGSIYRALGDISMALECRKQSLKIMREIGDKSGEGMTLNNIGEIYQSQGDTTTALEYLKQSLKIMREIGDKAGLIPTLHNMTLIEVTNQNLEQAVEYEMEAYQLAQETNDAMGLFHVGKYLGQILAVNGNKEEGMTILQRAYDIGQQAGFPGAEIIKQLMDKLGTGS